MGAGEYMPVYNDYNQALSTQRALHVTATQKASNSAPRDNLQRGIAHKSWGRKDNA